MIAVATDYLDAIAHLPAGGMLIFQHVLWEEYEELLEDLGAGYKARISYDHGRLEIMMLLPVHKYFRSCSKLVRRARRISAASGSERSAHSGLIAGATLAPLAALMRQHSFCTLAYFKDFLLRLMHVLTEALGRTSWGLAQLLSNMCPGWKDSSQLPVFMCRASHT